MRERESECAEERATTNAACGACAICCREARDECDALLARVATLETAIERALDIHASHYGHHDPKGTAGANCPACANDSERRSILRAAFNEAARPRADGAET